jgi:hypothetical protein
VILNMRIERPRFSFFLVSFLGWLFELFLEAFAVRGFVNRGFFYGSVVPVYTAGFFFAYALCGLLKNFPALVFFVSISGPHRAEMCYRPGAGKIFEGKGVGLRPPPLTFWCNYKKRIALPAVKSDPGPCPNKNVMAVRCPNSRFYTIRAGYNPVPRVPQWMCYGAAQGGRYAI